MAIKSATWDAKLVASSVVELKTITSVISGTSGRLTSSSTPTATETFDDTRTLGAGIDTIDLGSLPDSTDTTTQQRLRGLTLRLVKVFADSGNTNDVTVEPGAVSGHDLFGTGGKVVIPPGGVQFFYAASGGTAIPAGVANIDISSGNAGDIYSIQLVAG